MSGPQTVIINPLGGTLKHYTDVLAGYFREAGLRVDVLTIDEPSRSGRGRLHWLRQYFRALANADRRRPVAVIVTWPVIGYLDAVLHQMLMRHTPVYLVVHDPKPLTAGVGHSAYSRQLASLRPFRPRVIAHSAIAEECLLRSVTVRSAVALPLPTAKPRPVVRADDPRVTIRALGQYKPDRDLGALRAIAACGPSNARYEVIGRGWPAIEGWEVTDAFVAEWTFMDLLATSSVVVIPYRRFFQSEVAVRALECGTAIVGPADSSLRELLGDGHPWLASGDDDWPRAVDAARNSDPAEAASICTDLNRRAKREWTAWIVKKCSQGDRS